MGGFALLEMWNGTCVGVCVEAAREREEGKTVVENGLKKKTNSLV